VQILYHALVFFTALLILILQNGRSVSCIPCEEQGQIIFKIVQGRGRYLKRLYLDMPIGQKREARQSAKRRNVLVLFTNGLV
jgi:hypothetical protein